MIIITAQIDGLPLQDCLDTLAIYGGGTLNINPTGIYYLNNDLNVPNNVTIEGNNATLDFGGTGYGLKLHGGNPYSTGTVSINGGDVTVNGSGTTWTTAMIGQSILIGGGWYVITDVTSPTSITIESAYFGDNLVNSIYSIADALLSPILRNLTIINSTNIGLELSNVNFSSLYNIFIYNCGVGLQMNNVYGPELFVSCFKNGTNGIFNNVSSFEIRFSIFQQATSGDGLVLNDCYSETIIDSGFDGNFGNGISLTNCGQIAWVSCEVNSNGGNGIEFIDGNAYCQTSIVNVSNNIGDGLKLTANNTAISTQNSTCLNNGNYGINIVDNTSTNDIILGTIFNGNTSGTVNNLGTGTLIRSNIGVVDN